jgi:hypothetical protein
MLDSIDITVLQCHGYSPNQVIDPASIPASSLTAAFVRFIQHDIAQPHNPFRVSPFQLFLIADKPPNAKAIYHAGRYYLVVHHSVLELLGSTIYKKFPVLFPPDSKLNQFIARTVNTSLSAFVFEMISQYIYNHELAHLNQYKNLNTSTSKLQQEHADLTAGSKFDGISHAMELDADIFAATEMAFSLFAFWTKLSEIERRGDLLEALVALFGAGIFLFWETMQGGWPKIYFLDHTHPHILVRVTIMLDCITTVLHGAGDVYKPIERDSAQLQTLLLIDELLGNKTEHGLLSYWTMFTESVDDFDIYWKQHMVPISKGLPYLVQWNRPSLR